MNALGKGYTWAESQGFGILTFNEKDYFVLVFFIKNSGSYIPNDIH